MLTFNNTELIHIFAKTLSTLLADNPNGMFSITIHATGQHHPHHYPDLPHEIAAAIVPGLYLLRQQYSLNATISYSSVCYLNVSLIILQVGLTCGRF